MFDAALIVRLQDILFQKLLSLVTLVNLHAEVVELTNKALLPLYLKSLIVGCATELFL